jgi:CubicO group peptidase (beta-lactamase class C family)
MRNALSIILLALAGLTSGCQVGRALSGTIPASAILGIHDERTGRVGAVVRDTMRKEGIPGLSIAVIDHGDIVWAQGFGWRDVGKRLPVDTETQFQAGSISKPVTALAVLRLNASNKVDLDADVNRYLKSWHLDSKFTNKPVTLRELLCHRGGMVPHGFFGFSEFSRARSLDEVLNGHDILAGWLTAHYFGPIKVKYPPGSKYRYSGGGYCVVQKVVEEVTGEPFETVMKELVLEPLGMSRSNFQQPPLETENIAHGYGPLRGIVFRGRWRVYPEKAMGGLWSTPQDLARMIIAVQKAEAGETGGPIFPAIAEKLLTPAYDGWQGIGFRLGGEGKNRTFYHGGETYGYFARFAAGVSAGSGWVIMSNGQRDQFGPIARSIAREFCWAP